MGLTLLSEELMGFWLCESLVSLQGVKLTFFSGSHLAPKCFKVVADSKKLVAIMTHTQTIFTCHQID